MSCVTFHQESSVHAVLGPGQCQKHTDTQTDIATYRRNRPRGLFSEKYLKPHD